MWRPSRHDICYGRVPSALLIAAAALVAASAPTRSALAQSGNESMFVSVLDSAGAPVLRLTTTDFIVEEDGAEREILEVRPARAPMQVAVLVDTSGSVTGATGDIRRGLETFVERLSDGNELAIVTFGGPPRILVESTGRLDRLREGIGQVFPSSNNAAYLLDALLETARGFERRESPRPVIIAITGEGLDYSYRDSRQVLDALRDSLAAAHMIVLRGGLNVAVNSDFGVLDSGRERDIVLEQGPVTSGGQRYDVMLSARLDTALDEIAAVILSQYEVVYSRPASLIPPEAITVRMRRDDLSARGTPVRRAGG
ncbi:MAG: VWA domain-containing protein [bacterium]